EFGDEDDLVIVVRGKDSALMRQAIDALANETAQQPERFDRLFYKVDLAHLRDRALLFLSPEQIKSIQENVHRMGPLLAGPTGPLAWRSVTLFQLLRQARERVGKFDPDAALPPADEQFLTQLL